MLGAPHSSLWGHLKDFSKVNYYLHCGPEFILTFQWKKPQKLLSREALTAVGHSADTPESQGILLEPVRDKPPNMAK